MKLKHLVTMALSFVTIFLVSVILIFSSTDLFLRLIAVLGGFISVLGYIYALSKANQTTKKDR